MPVVPTSILFRTAARKWRRPIQAQLYPMVLLLHIAVKLRRQSLVVHTIELNIRQEWIPQESKETDGKKVVVGDACNLMFS